MLGNIGVSCRLWILNLLIYTLIMNTWLIDLKSITIILNRFSLCIRSSIACIIRLFIRTSYRRAFSIIIVRVNLLRLIDHVQLQTYPGWCLVTDWSCLNLGVGIRCVCFCVVRDWLDCCCLRLGVACWVLLSIAAQDVWLYCIFSLLGNAAWWMIIISTFALNVIFVKWIVWHTLSLGTVTIYTSGTFLLWFLF